jgi:hypothetical protein
LHQLAIPLLVRCLGFIKQKLGEHTLVGHLEHGIPFGDIAAGQGIYGVDVLKLFERADARPLLQRCRIRSKQLVLGFDKAG